jgi:hypothetical protein
LPTHWNKRYVDTEHIPDLGAPRAGRNHDGARYDSSIARTENEAAVGSSATGDHLMVRQDAGSHFPGGGRKCLGRLLWMSASVEGRIDTPEKSGA